MTARLTTPRGVLNVREFGAVGDGVTDDTAAIQAALYAAAGGELYFPPGDYAWTGIKFIPSDTTLTGVPGRSILTRIGEPDDWAEMWKMACFTNLNWYTNTDKNIHLYGLSCRWAEDSPEPHTTPGGGTFVRLACVDKFSVDHCESFNSNESNIYAGDCHHGTITNNYIHGFADTGIGLASCTDVVISGNVVVDGGDGISVIGEPAVVVSESYTTPDFSNNIVVSGNVVRDMYAIGIGMGDGGSDADNSRYVVSGNMLDNCRVSIVVNGSDINVANNVVSDPGVAGIWVHPANTDYQSRPCARISVTGNTVSGYDLGLVYAGEGIIVGSDQNDSGVLSDVLVANNVVSDAAYDGIRVRATGASAAFSHLSIVGNVLSGNGRYVDAFSGGASNFAGVYAMTGGGGTITAVTIRGNKMHDAKVSKTQNRSFQIDGAGCTGFVVTGNETEVIPYISGSGHIISGNIGDSTGALAVTGARDDGTALASLLTHLATLGIVTDSSTAS